MTEMAATLSNLCHFLLLGYQIIFEYFIELLAYAQTQSISGLGELWSTLLMRLFWYSPPRTVP